MTISGTVKRVACDKGSGCIAADSEQGYFFHSSACRGIRVDELREGQGVTFEPGQGTKGPRAGNVQLASATAGGPAQL